MCDPNVTAGSARLRELMNRADNGEAPLPNGAVAAAQIPPEPDWKADINDWTDNTPSDAPAKDPKRKLPKAPWQAKDVHEAVTICAAMDPLTYEQHREMVADTFDLKRVSALDDAVKAARKKSGDDEEDVFGWTVKQAPRAVDGVEGAR
jgi:hypothetical protein